MSKSDEQIEREGRQKQRRETTKALPPDRVGRTGIADWANASAESVLQLVCLVGLQGGAVRFGYTRDGGAYSVGIYLGENSKTYYCNESEGINEQLQDLISYFK